MIAINFCPCCGSKSCIKRPAIVAPFIKEYVLNNKEEKTYLLKCKKCGFIFFDKRFTQREVAKLYGKYRKKEYFEARNKREPYYTKKVNDSIENPTERKLIIEDFLNKNSFEGSLVKSVLDYGGDRGQFFPNLLKGSEKYLYETSDYKAVRGVHKIKDSKELFRKRFDLIFACNLLEHVSFPNEFLEEISRLLTNEGYLYIEVPSEKFIFNSKKSMAYNLSLNNKFLFLANDIASLLLRLRFGFLPSFGIIKLHEHINFYDIQSLKTLLENNGFIVEDITERKVGLHVSGRSAIIQCIAKKSNI